MPIDYINLNILLLQIIFYEIFYEVYIILTNLSRSSLWNPEFLINVEKCFKFLYHPPLSASYHDIVDFVTHI